ncbi:MAG: hypothetical protein M3297_02385 [Thermoproteota archaeon]|jgi:hypothetical protein|nr:hypothetical protein [Thermoproteota archaeon]
MASLETWIALGSLSMSAMFIALMFSFYIFLVGPGGKGPDVATDPRALLIQVISISGAPALILAGTVMGVSRGEVKRSPGIILFITGSSLLIAMVLLTESILPQLGSQFRLPEISYVPIIFTLAGVGIIGCGLTALRNKRKTRRSLEG